MLDRPELGRAAAARVPSTSSPSTWSTAGSVARPALARRGRRPASPTTMATSPKGCSPCTRRPANRAGWRGPGLLDRDGAVRGAGRRLPRHRDDAEPSSPVPAVLRTTPSRRDRPRSPVRSHLLGADGRPRRLTRASRHGGGLGTRGPRAPLRRVGADGGRSRRGGTVQVAVVGKGSLAEDLLDAARRSTSPGAVVVAGQPDADGVPLLADRPLVDGGPAAYVCRGFVCDLPATTVHGLEAALSLGLTPHPTPVAPRPHPSRNAWDGAATRGGAEETARPLDCECGATRGHASLEWPRDLTRHETRGTRRPLEVVQKGRRGHSTLRVAPRPHPSRNAWDGAATRLGTARAVSRGRRRGSAGMPRVPRPRPRPRRSARRARPRRCHA